MLENINIDELVNDREKFNAFVYTPVEEAVTELKRRREDKALEKKVSELLGGDIPKPFLDGPRAVLFRQLATPNYEVRRFVSIADGVEDMRPCFWEFYDDKFTSNNEWKYSLGRMGFYFGRSANGTPRVQKKSVVVFEKFDGKKISSVETIWGQSLVSFHHELFKNTYIPLSDDWRWRLFYGW
ncbi:MAG TPA: hypothetical protein VMR37_04640 [Rhabdochlamydiaceae bacterium]|nr:hypothetical protein [Rhabdochlamydiaceae bacterium]